MNYFTLSIDNLIGKILNDAFDSAILLHPEDERTLVIFYEYDSQTNGIIYYENEENWGSQYLPKEEVWDFYLDCRNKGYKPARI